ncbi:HK97 family phage prohead protease [Bacillus subtilis]|uniref:HK97 family phage prohead protease n=1 Tax=Bacillus subtilis TaxID=1423 RepID=UPI00398BE774
MIKLPEEKLKFFVEADVDLKKSEEEGDWYIRGYGSTENEDRQGECMIQKGLDISDFLKCGFLNYDHDNSQILGYPTENTHIDDRGLWIEGVLLKDVPLAQRMWNLAKSLKKSNAPRKLGFSIEGKVLERKGNRIVKAKVYHCAITPTPANTDATWEAVVKSFNGDADVSKTMEAGYATTPETQSDGGALRRESVEQDIKRIAANLDNFNYWENVKRNLANGDTVSKSEMVVFLQLSKGLSRGQALEIVKD